MYDDIDSIMKELHAAAEASRNSLRILIHAQLPDSDCGTTISQDEINAIVEQIKNSMDILKRVEYKISTQNALEAANLMTIVKEGVAQGNTDVLNKAFCLGCDNAECVRKKAYT